MFAALVQLLVAGLLFFTVEYGWNIIYLLRTELKSTKWSCDPLYAPEAEVLECSTNYYNKHYRTLSGKCNNLDYPYEGTAGGHFQRIGKDHQDIIQDASNSINDYLYTPDPYEVAQAFLHTLSDQDVETAPYMNILLSSWVHFIVHDLVGHETFDIDHNPHQINDIMNITRQKASDNQTPGCPYKQFKNKKTAFFDGSQLYGIDESIHNSLMDPDDARKFKLEYVEKWNEYQIPFNIETNKYIIGETGNFWSGLNIFHLLFAQEHNHIVDELDTLYSDTMNALDQYHTARLIISAIMAQIHIMEFFPVAGAANGPDWIRKLILENKYLINQFKLDEVDDFNDMDNLPIRFDIFLKLTELIDDGNEHIPFQKSELFDVIYTVHNIFTEDLCLNHLNDRADIENKIDCSYKLSDTFLMNNTRNINNKYSMKDILYSFGTLNHPAYLKLNTYPPSLTQFTTDDGNIVDLATVDTLRIRERGIPRYTKFRELLGLEEIISYNQLTDDEELISKLESVYDSIDDLDVNIGMWLENTGN